MTNTSLISQSVEVHLVTSDTVFSSLFWQTSHLHKQGLFSMFALFHESTYYKRCVVSSDVETLQIQWFDILFEYTSELSCSHLLLLSIFILCDLFKEFFS
jgi:hypothetical protein